MKFGFLLALGSIAAYTASAGASPQPALPPSSPAGKIEISTPGSARVMNNGGLIRNNGREFTLRKGDTVFQGTAKAPVHYKSDSLSLSASWVLFSPLGAEIQAFKSPLRPVQVSLKGTFPQSPAARSVRIEATCDSAKLVKGVWTLEGQVSGFYENAAGRQSLRGQSVKISAFQNAISLVQDGVISLIETPIN